MTAYVETMETLRAHRRRIAELQEEMRQAQKAVEPQPVEDYLFMAMGGPVRLSSLFGGKTDLFVIHNMGRSCAYCTLWADGFNGVYPHLANRAAFVVSSPDSPEQQQARRRPRLALPHGQPRRHDVRRRHGLCARGQVLAGRFRLPPAQRRHRAGQRRRARPRRRLLQRLAFPGPVARGRRRLVAEIPLRWRVRRVHG